MPASTFRNIILLFALLNIFPADAFSQSEQQVEILLGLGNYEYLHGGVKLTKDKGYFESAIGIDPLNHKSDKYYMGYLTIGYFILKDQFPKIKPSLQFKTLVWNLENPYNRFVMGGFGPELRLGYNLKENFQLYANSGMLYNSLLHYERKTYLEVGWPKEFQPSFSFQLAYRIK